MQQQQLASEVVLTAYTLFGQISSFQKGLTTNQHDALHKAKAVLYAQIISSRGCLYDNLRVSQLRNTFDDISELTDDDGWKLVCKKFEQIDYKLDMIADYMYDDERSQALQVLRPIKNRDWICNELKRLTDIKRAERWLRRHQFAQHLVYSFL